MGAGAFQCQGELEQSFPENLLDFPGCCGKFRGAVESMQSMALPIITPYFARAPPCRIATGILLFAWATFPRGSGHHDNETSGLPKTLSSRQALVGATCIVMFGQCIELLI